MHKKVKQSKVMWITRDNKRMLKVYFSITKPHFARHEGYVSEDGYGYGMCIGTLKKLFPEFTPKGKSIRKVKITIEDTK